MTVTPVDIACKLYSIITMKLPGLIPPTPSAFRGRGGLVAAMLVDSIGTGLFLPFVVVYFLHMTSLPLPVIGVSLSVAALAALPTPALVGALIDRFGAQRMVGLGNLVSAVAFLAYVVVGSAWQLVAAAFLVSVGQTTFWTATRALVGVIAEPSERTTWFALQSRARNAGYGLGGILGAGVVAAGSNLGYLLLAVANAVSYLIAAGLILRWRAPTGSFAYHQALSTRVTEMAAPQLHRARGSYRLLLADRGLLLVSGTNLVFVLCSSVLTVLLAVYLTRVLAAPVWLTGVMFTLDTVLVVTAQGVISRKVNAFHRPRVLQAAAGCFAISFIMLWALASAPAWLTIPGLIVAITVFTIAEMLEGPLINALVVDMAPAYAPGRYLAAYQLSWSLAAVVAPGLLTWLLTIDISLPWIALLGFCALAIGAIHVIPTRHTQTNPPTS